MKKSSKIAILALALAGGAALLSTSVYAMWAVFQKEDTSASFDEVHYTVSFYADENQKTALYTYPGLEIDSEFPLPTIEDTSAKHFKGWKEKGESTIYSSSLKLLDLATLDKTHHTVSLYGAYDPILTITTTPDKTLSGVNKNSVSVILNEDPLTYLLSNLGMPLEAKDSNSVAYHLVSFTYSGAKDVAYKHLKSDGTYEEATGKTFPLNDALILSSSTFGDSLALIANYVEVLS